jgi:hypothetical protein
LSGTTVSVKSQQIIRDGKCLLGWKLPEYRCKRAGSPRFGDLRVNPREDRVSTVHVPFTLPDQLQEMKLPTISFMAAVASKGASSKRIN